VAAAVRARGRRFRGYACNFSDRPALYAFIAAVQAECPPIDILVNNAGTILRQPAAEHPEEYWDKVLETNLSAQSVLTRELGHIWWRGVGPSTTSSSSASGAS